MSAGNLGRGFGLPFSQRSLGPPRPSNPSPPVPGSDLEYERSLPITRDDRMAMLRRYFAGRGLSQSQIEAAMRNAKV